MNDPLTGTSNVTYLPSLAPRSVGNWTFYHGCSSKSNQTQLVNTDDLFIIDVELSLIQSRSSYYYIKQFSSNERDWIFRHDDWRRTLLQHAENGYTLVFLYHLKLSTFDQQLIDIYLSDRPVIDLIPSDRTFQLLLARIREITNSFLHHLAAERVLHHVITVEDDVSNPIMYQSSIAEIVSRNSKMDLSEFLKVNRVIPSKRSIYVGPHDYLYSSNDSYLLLMPELNPNLRKTIINFPYYSEVIILVGQKGSGKHFLAEELKIKGKYLIMNSSVPAFRELLIEQLKESRNNRSVSHGKQKIVINGFHPDIQSRKLIIDIVKMYDIPIRIFWLQTVLNIEKDRLKVTQYSDRFETPTAYESAHVLVIH